ncbi:hypothetical protein L211DRAFT_764423, partial [Terfezia boudieri ATCC MYA-4762]
GDTRIMVATSAWGMGINDSHVERVIQWRVGAIPTLDTLIQHFGRCARNPLLQGVCIAFVEQSCV